MTVLNTNYSTLEDAWGSNFDTNAKPKSKKTKHAKDPLCDLYGKRYNKIKKPFASNPSKSSTPLDDEYLHRYDTYKHKDTRTYTGYKDDEVEWSRPDANHLMLENEDEYELDEETCMKIIRNKEKKNKHNRKSRKVRFEEVTPEDEDDIYLQNAINRETRQLRDEAEETDESEMNSTKFNDVMNVNDEQNFKQIYSNVYDESDDEVEPTRHSRKNNTYKMDKNSCVDREMLSNIQDEYSKLISEQLKNSPYLNKNPTIQENLKRNNDERHYLDLVIYILSGIILIFMMEQFIQIGMKLKNPYIVEGS